MRISETSGEWPSMPYTGRCVLTWEIFKNPSYTRRTQAIMRNKWLLNLSPTS